MTTKPNASQVEYQAGWTVADEFNTSAINVKRFGAVGDGVADDTAAVAAAISAVADGGEIYVPAGAWRILSLPTTTKTVFFIIAKGATFTDLSLKTGYKAAVADTLDDSDNRYYSIDIDNDDVDATANGGIKVNGFKVIMYPTADSIGGRHAVVGQVIVRDTNTAANPDKRWVGVVGHVRVNTSQGGTGTELGTGVGSVFAMNPFVYVAPGVENLRNVTGGEVNTAMSAGSSSWLKTGWSIVSSDDAQATEDTGLAIQAGNGKTGYKVGVGFSRSNGGYGVSETFFKASGYSGQTRVSLLDFDNIVWSGNVINTNVFKVGNTGNLLLGNGQANTGISFFSSQASATADARIISIGGSPDTYKADLQVDAERFLLNNVSSFRSSTDNATVLGSSAFRFSQTYSREFRPGGGSVIWTSGTGSPEGVVSAPVGSLFTRTDGDVGTTLYVKQSGTGSAGWSAK